MFNRRAITITLALCVFVIFLGGWIKPIAQNKKSIVRRLTLTKEPVDISFKLKGQPLNANHAVHAEEELAVRVNSKEDLLKCGPASRAQSRAERDNRNSTDREISQHQDSGGNSRKSPDE
jgi:hypothetical protein